MGDYFGSVCQAFSRKVSVCRTGRSRVSGSCQLPSIRNKYYDLGLKKNSGYFVEIGAFDGETFSNTSFLADEGWAGLYVEPIPAFYRQTKLRHMFNNVTVENVAISGSTGMAMLTAMGSLSTLDIATAEAYKKFSWSKSSTKQARQIRVTTAKLDDVLRRNRVPKNFELLVVDVEGHEEEILRNLLLSDWRPHTIIVEQCDQHPDFSTIPGCTIHIEKHDYL